MDKKKIIEIASLEIDCKIGKDRHFIAADRKNKLRIALGLFSVIGSAIISSGVGASTSKLVSVYAGENIHWSDWAAVFGHVLPLLVGISTAVIGFLGLEKQTAQHRFVGNAYIEVARKARSILNSINDINYAEKIVEYEALLERYLEINKEGETSPTNDKDSKKAMGMNAAKRSAIKAKISEFEKVDLDIKERPFVKKVLLRSVLLRTMRVRMAGFFACVGLLRKSDYREYLKKLN